MSELNNELRAAAQVIAQFTQDFRQFGRVSTKTQDEFAAGSKEQADKLKYAGALASRSLGEFTRGMSQFASTLYQGQTGMGAFDGALDGVSSAADSLASSFKVLGGPFFVAASFLAKIISGAAKITKAINANADKEYKAYSDLAKTGATARDGMQGTTETARKLGLDVSRLGDFVSLIQKGGKDLALFAGGSAQGRKLLGDLGESLKDERQNFLRLGISVNDANAAMVGMLATQSAMGRSFGGNLNEVGNSVKEYIYEMDVLQRVSGKTREAIESARQDALKEERFAAAVYKAEREEPGGGKLITDLQDRIDARLGPEVAKGIRDIVTDMPGTEEATALLNTNNTELLKLIPLYKQKKISLDDLEQRVITNIATFAKEGGIQLGLYNSTGKHVLSMSSQTRALTLSQNNVVKTQKDARQQQANAKKGADPLADLAAQVEAKQREAKAKIDHLADMMIGPLASAMGKMLNIVDDMVDGIKSMLGWFLGKEPEQRRATDATVANMAKNLADVEREFSAAQAKAQQTQRAEDKAVADALAEQVAQAKASLASEKELLAQGTAEDRRKKRIEARRAGEPAEPSSTAPTAPEGVKIGGVGPAPSTLPSNVKLQPDAKISGVNPELLKRFYGFAQEWGQPLSLNSAVRTDAKQAELWVRSTYFHEPGIFIPSKPKETTKIEYKGQKFIVQGSGRGSSHGDGLALDVTGNGITNTQTQIDTVLAKFGLYRPFLTRDAPHIQMLADGGIATSPSIAGEAGPEAVIPLMNGRIPIELGNVMRDLAGMVRLPATETSSTADSAAADMPNLDSLVSGAVATVMNANTVEQEMLDILDRIRRANRDTANNNQKILRAHTN